MARAWKERGRASAVMQSSMSLSCLHLRGRGEVWVTTLGPHSAPKEQKYANSPSLGPWHSKDPWLQLPLLEGAAERAQQWFCVRSPEWAGLSLGPS